MKIKCYFQRWKDHLCYGFVIPWKVLMCSSMIETSSVLTRKSSKLFGNLKKVIGNLRKIVLISMFIYAHSWDIKLNTRREIPHLCATMYYPLFSIRFPFKRVTILRLTGNWPRVFYKPVSFCFHISSFSGRRKTYMYQLSFIVVHFQLSPQDDLRLCVIMIYFTRGLSSAKIYSLKPFIQLKLQQVVGKLWWYQLTDNCNLICDASKALSALHSYFCWHIYWETRWPHGSSSSRGH